MAQKGVISRKIAKSAKGDKRSNKIFTGEDSGQVGSEEAIASFKSAAGIILAVTENRTWIEVFFEGDLMHTKTVDLPEGMLFNIYVEEIPHKTTVYEHPRTMIFFDSPCDLEITRDGERVVVSGSSAARENFV